MIFQLLLLQFFFHYIHYICLCLSLLFILLELNLSFSHIPPFVSVIPVDLLIQPSFVYLIPVILVFDEACLCILYTYPQCTCPLILLFLLDLYKCCKTMRYSQLHGLIESCNLHQRCVHICYKASLHMSQHIILASISVNTCLHAMQVMDFSALSTFVFFPFFPAFVLLPLDDSPVDIPSLVFAIYSLVLLSEFLLGMLYRLLM